MPNSVIIPYSLVGMSPLALIASNDSVPSEDDERSSIYQATEALDRVFVWASIAIGMPGNLLTFFTFRTFPNLASIFMLKCMAGFDMAGLLLVTSLRFLDWENIVNANSAADGIGWTIYFNCSNFVAIFANNVFILVMMERLVFIRFPDMISQYISMDRVRLNLAIFLILFASFNIVVIVKMTYFGVAWIFVYTIFYALWPVLVVFIMLALIISHYHHVRAERKKLERNKKLFPSQSSNVNKSPSKYSGISASGASGAGSLGAESSTPKKRNPYGALMINKSVSESFLSSSSTKMAASTSSGGLQKTMGIKGLQSEVNLKVPFKGDSLLFSEQLVNRNGSTSEDSCTDREKNEMETQITRSVLSLAVFFILLMLPICAINFLFIQQFNDTVNPSLDDIVFLKVTLVLGLSLFWHASKFIVFFLCSSLFRRGIFVIFKKRPQIVIETHEPEAV